MRVIADIIPVSAFAECPQIDLIFDSLAQQCREAQAQAQVPLPGDDRFDPEELSIGICRWMKEEGFGPAQGGYNTSAYCVSPDVSVQAIDSID